MSRLVIFVNGRDPLIPYSGAETYVRATGRAAVRAGYEPHVFCVGEASHVTETPFGVVHCTRTPFRPIRTLMAAAHGPFIVRAIARFATGIDGPCLIHSFGDWSGVAANAARRIERRGLRCKLAATVWTTYAHETRGKLLGAGKAHGLETRIRLRCELGWTLLGIMPGVLRHADIYALPSTEEGNGSVSLLEALQAGVAPVVSRVDGLPEDVTDGEHALLTAPGATANLGRRAGSLPRTLLGRCVRGGYRRGLRKAGVCPVGIAGR